MTVYGIVLFLHIVGALGLFVTFGLEWASLAYMQRAMTAEQAREWLGVRSWVMRLGPASLALLLLSGIYMIATSWGLKGWIIAAFASLVLLAVLGATLTGMRLVPIERSLASERGNLSPAMRRQLSDPLMWTSILTRTAIGLGVVFVMVVKPVLVGSLGTIVFAAVVGFALSLPGLRRRRATGKEALSRS